MPYKDPEKYRKYRREYHARRKDAWFEGKVCAGCGSDENLQLDHVDPSQKVTHRVWFWSQERRDVELAKCQALCAPCHREKTTLQQELTHGYTPRQHGERRTYNAGCRCRPCKDAAAQYSRDRRARKKS